MSLSNLTSTKSKSFRRQVVKVPFPNLIPVLKVIKEEPQITQTRLRKKANISSGQAYRVIVDARAMKLVENGNGYILTDLGEEWIRCYEETQDVSQELMRKAALNVPIFKELFNVYPEMKDYEKVYLFLDEKAPENISSRFIGSVTRRYLESVHGIRIEGRVQTPDSERSRTEKDEEESIEPKESLDNLTIQSRTIKATIEITHAINKIENEYGKELTTKVLSELLKN